MKKQSYLTHIIFGIFIIGLLTACGRDGEGETENTERISQGPAEEITILNRVDYLNPDVLSEFEEEFDILISIENYGRDIELNAVVNNSGLGFALVIIPDYYLVQMKRNGDLAALHHELIPNLNNLASDFRNPLFDLGNEFCVPYQWGMTGIGYDSERTDPPVSWGVIFEPDPDSPSYGRTTLLNEPRETFAAALLFLGYDPNTTNRSELEEARDLIISAKNGLDFSSNGYAGAVASGAKIYAHGRNESFTKSLEETPTLSFTIPEEGGIIRVDNLCVPQNATPEQQESAEILINYLLEPEVGAMISLYNFKASPNEEADPLLGLSFTTDPMLYPAPGFFEKLEYLRPLGEFEALYEDLWAEVMAAP